MPTPYDLITSKESNAHGLRSSRSSPKLIITVGEPDFPIIGIGASAGGLEAFHSFFAHMPVDCGMAFVVILHLPAERKSMLTEILARWTSMRVREAIDGTRIEANCVYVPTPHAIVKLSEGQRLSVHFPNTVHDRLFRPIDGFFDSLAVALREQAVGIVLSGTGSDGALGLKAIKECGGLTIAQGSNGSAPQYGEMPAGAIATGAVDLIVPVEDIPGHLMRMKGREIRPIKSADDANNKEAARLEICAILRARLGHDFSGYRAQTFLRRVERRMQVVNATSLQDYVSHLQEDQNESGLLFRDLLIRVTSFFRDKETFETLETSVIPKLFAGKQADSAVRIWVPGCATGEEAYSLAILLREHMDTLQGPPKVQVFATDIDDSAVATARLGRYPTALIEGLSADRRDRFFVFSQGSYLVDKEIRELCTFSTHNLVRDPPFSRMDLVSCRNLLIYMNTELQAKVIPIFHYSLNKGGTLLLGGSESTSQHANLFEPLDKAARIFKKRNVESPDLELSLQRSSLQSPASTQRAFCGDGGNFHSVLNDQSSGNLHPRSNESRRDNDHRDDLAATHEHLLGSLGPTAETVAQLQDALRGALEQLGSLHEEHQTALEELRSSNEELHSVNEEMQSSNEELETSKEELQSLNEELHTVNARLTEKIDELAQANSDLRNLFDSTEVATVFLDRHLIIRSFTPSIATLYNLIPSDQGRPLTDIVSRLNYNSLREDVAHVLSTLEPLERRVARDDLAVHYMLRILPYREPDSTVSGALVTLVDVSSIVQAEAALVEADVRKDIFLATLSHELRNPLAPIRTAAQLLQSPKLGRDELMRAQAIIARQVTHMSSLLDDLLDVSRITRGSFLLKKEYVDAKSLMEAAVEAVQPAIDSRQHTLRVEYPPEPMWLEVDPVRIAQVINNLLTNAAKYTRPGGVIELGTRLEGHALAIFVRDNGAGLAPEMIPKIFNMFTQVESDLGRSEGGLGIGLALAKGLIELHGGRIEARSAGLGQGSEFCIILPKTLMVGAPAKQPSTSDGGASRVVGRRILVADDNRDGAETMSLLLSLAGHEVHVAHTGTEAFELANRVRPDVGVLDIGMPDLNGYEVAQRIRHEAWGENITLIAVTGWGQTDDKRRALAAGFNNHLTKPVDPDQLEGLLKPKNEN